MKKRKDNIFHRLLLMIAVCGLGMATPVSVYAGTLYESPYVKWTMDNYAWTVSEKISNAPLYEEVGGKKPFYWYTQGEKVETGIASTLRALKEGEHYYTVQRAGEVPIKYWQVDHSEGKCIHDCTVDYWHGVENKGYNGEHCNRAYYSGWTAYCADCGGKLNTSIVYMSKEAAASITSVDTNKGYYYVCPSCEHIENTMGVVPHECKAISFNRYRVVYEKNDNGSGTVGGYMDDSYHMYNNETVYRGQKITPVGRLSKNVYTRTGYVFTGWNTKPNGKGEAFQDCERILNLSKHDYNSEPEKGTVTLYAQWEPAESTLKMELKGGTYDDAGLEGKGGNYDRKTGIVTLTKCYGETYNANPVYVIPPLGYKVSFDTNGGENVSSVTQQQSFAGWIQSNPFAGKMRGDVYAFVGADGSVDTIKANYKNQPIILPDAVKEGYSFGGWYRDRNHTVFVGFAGDEYTAFEDVILYAKWVELALISKENYTDNEGNGAVDLSWSQPDGKDKTYKVYMAKANGDFSLISNKGDVLEDRNISKTYEYNAEYRRESYIIPYSGFYELSAAGGQGGDYGKKSGGKGGMVTGKFYLNAGEKLTIAVGGKGGSADENGGASGGKGGYNGGKGTSYAGGGGATTITSNRQGLLLVAGGGGGASPAGNGGKGGLTESNRDDGNGNGQGGQAGGGGGFLGGSKGEQIVHIHETDCYKTENLSYDFTLFKSKTSFSSEDMRNQNKVATHEMCSADGGQITVDGHTNGENANFLIKIGDEKNLIPVKGNKRVSIPFYSYVWGQGDGFKDVAYLRVFDQNGKRIKNFKLSECYTMEESKSGANYMWIGKKGGTPKEFVVELEEGTVGIYIIIYLPVHHVINGTTDDSWGAWLDAKVEPLKFSGGTKKTKICGYKDEQVLSSKPAYGGSNYVSEFAVNVKADGAGVCSGNGKACIQSVKIGFLTELNINGVPAPDELGPGKISSDSDKLVIRGVGRNGVEVSFQKPVDNGTGYRFVAESYVMGSGEALCKSNETEETLITGVAGYYYILDSFPEKVVTEDNAQNKENMLPTVSEAVEGTWESLRVDLTEEVMYLHIAAVDRAGNIGITSHIMLSRDAIPGGVATGQITVTDRINNRTYQTVYPKDDRNFYVRADGETPFQLSFPSYLSGVATPAYQIDYQMFDVVADTLHQRYSTRIPVSNPIVTEETLESLDFVREMTGDSILRDAMNSSAIRKYSATENEFHQAFTISADYHGKKLLVTPVAGVSNNLEGTYGYGEVFYSDWSDDILHGVTLIADGEGPVINGLEILETPELLNRNGGTFTLNVSADDAHSGIREFHVEVTNTDNSISEIYVPESGVIKLEITEDNPVFRGDFVVVAYATDNVGNETVVSGGLTEFALTAVVERILAPHEPLFKRGESGILSITVWGYADRVEVEFPEEFVQQNPGLNQTWWYTDSPKNKRQETLQFMVPLGELQEEKYKITVRAYKNGRMLEEYPEIRIIGTESVAEEFRTRLR